MAGHRIPRAAVPAWLRDTCEQAAREAAQLLEIPVPVLHWLKGDDPRFGWVETDDLTSINLNVDRLGEYASERLAKTLTYHEVRHLWQKINYSYWDRQLCEKDAARWSTIATGYFVDTLPEWEL